MKVGELKIRVGTTVHIFE